jgi:hypothetical protein
VIGMASRMEKYHSGTSQSGTRSVRNESLYKDIYENAEYSNIEGIAAMEKTNEISLEQIRELLKERETNKKRSLVNREVKRTYVEPVEERNYDIRDVLVKAKDNHVESNENRRLNNTQLNVFKGIDDKDKSYDDEEIERTLVNTGVLKGFNDSELSLDMLSDLKSTGNTVVNKTNSALLLKEVEEAKDKYQVKEDDGLDKSFYTSSLNFKDEDFEQLKDIQDSIENNNKMIKTLFILFTLVVLVVVGFILYKVL